MTDGFGKVKVTSPPPLRLHAFLGHISRHAEILSSMARAIGREVREDFNGDDLIARPGMSAVEIEQDWVARRAERQAQK